MNEQAERYITTNDEGDCVLFGLNLGYMHTIDQTSLTASLLSALRSQREATIRECAAIASVYDLNGDAVASSILALLTEETNGQ